MRKIGGIEGSYTVTIENEKNTYFAAGFLISLFIIKK